MADGAGGPTVLRILLGTQLRRLRESRGITAQEAARAIRGSESKISRIELGRNAVREVDIADLLSLYGITDTTEREQLLSLARLTSLAGGIVTRTSCPAGSRHTSAWRNLRSRSAATTRSSSLGCCRPRITRPR